MNTTHPSLAPSSKATSTKTVSGKPTVLKSGPMAANTKVSGKMDKHAVKVVSGMPTVISMKGSGPTIKPMAMDFTCMQMVPNT